MLGAFFMNHNPLLSFNDGLEITYSDLKRNDKGEYVTLYFEKPNNRKTGFNSASFDFPGTSFTNVIGFTKRDLSNLMKHVIKTGMLALEFAREDSDAQIS